MARTFFEATNRILPRHLNHLQESTLESLRQLRLALGTGTIFYGLTVEATRGNAVLVSPGLAFDGNGDPLAIGQPMRVALPDGRGPHILAVGYFPVVEERSTQGEAVIESDSVQFHWLPALPDDESVVPLATVSRATNGRILVDEQVGRRAPPLEHHHSAVVQPDRSGRVRFSGAPMVENEPAVRPSDLNLALERLRSELLARIDAVAAQQPPPAPPPSNEAAGWEPPIELIHGIGESYAQALAQQEVRTVPELLRRAATRAGRQALSRGAGIPPSRLELFARVADFMRLHGVTPEYARLLSDAGFWSVAEIATTDPAVVAERVRQVFNADVHNAKKPPRPALVRAWVQEAVRLPSISIEPG